MKIRKLFKKAAALALAAVTALSIMPAQAAFAAGDIGTISFTHTYDSDGNAMRYNSSAVINGYTAGGTGNYHYRMFIDGETGFCIQPGVPLKTDRIYSFGLFTTGGSGSNWKMLSATYCEIPLLDSLTDCFGMYPVMFHEKSFSIAHILSVLFV